MHGKVWGQVRLLFMRVCVERPCIAISPVCDMSIGCVCGAALHSHIPIHTGLGALCVGHGHPACAGGLCWGGRAKDAPTINTASSARLIPGLKKG